MISRLPAIMQVAESLGLHLTRSGGMAYIACPAGRHEHDDAAPKCHVGGAKETAHCFKCGWSADSVGLVKAIKGLETADAFAWLRERFPVEMREDAPAAPSDPMVELCARRDWCVDALLALGCANTPLCVKFPMLDAEGKPTGYKLRRADGGLIAGQKSHTEKGGKLGLFYAAPLGPGRVLVTEGEADTVAAMSAGWSPVVGTAGAYPGARSGEVYLQRLLATREVALAPDPGDSGRMWLSRVGRLLANVQCAVWYIPADAKHDLDDRLRNQDDKAAVLGALIAGAIPWQENAGREGFDYHTTDTGNAEHFASLHGDRVRYDHGRGRWLVWSGHWWRSDCDGELHRLMVETARERWKASAAIDDKDERKHQAGWALSSESRSRCDSALFMARMLPPITDAGQDWDRDPNLLGVANGVLNLATGELEEGNPDQRVTQSADIPYLPEARCARWLRFLNEVFAGDDDLIDFVHRAVGYSLTGHTYEQCFFLCHGSGSNGKTILLGALAMMLGTYAGNTPFSTFELSRRSNIPNDVAALCGKRLVTSSETTKALRLNEGRVKSLSGGDPITARFLHAEYFTFEPQFKLWLAVNDKPRIEDTSHGFWRRVRLVPFEVRFEGENEDKFLRYVLKEEYPGILAWAVQGSVAWQQRGLEPPACVVAATTAYQEESDPLAQFLADRCALGDGCAVFASDFYAEYLEWAHEQHLPEKEKASSRSFGEEMGRRFKRTSSHVGKRVGRIYHGVGLLREEKGIFGGENA